MIDYDPIAAAYARHRQVHPGVLQNLVEVSGAGRTARLLEVGCGTGNYIVALQSLLDCACWGIDPSEEMLTRARERSDRVQFQRGSAEHLGLPADSFDLLFSVDVIHHLRDRAAYFRQAHRALSPGGKICTVTDSEWIIRQRQPLAIYFPETVERELARYPRIAQLRALMADVGFEQIEEHSVEFPYQLADAQAYRDKAFSSLHLIPEVAFQRGLARMERDLRQGPIPCVSRYLLLWGVK